MQPVYIENYDYELPQSRIALYPLEQRDAAKLLVYKKGQIAHHHFYELPDLLPKKSLLVFNNTKVIPARIYFYKKTGAKIEILLLQPVGTEMQIAMQQTQRTVWECMIGNQKKWKTDSLTLTCDYEGNTLTLQATWHNKEKQQICFEWTPAHVPFANVIDAAGKMPIPPYIPRDAEDSDKERYQTVYAQHQGSVAAPTAGLHFTENVLKKLQEQHINSAQLTLHVGAGTFKPVTVSDAGLHEMHYEQISVDITTLQQLQQAEKIVAVGTTSARTLESLYWLGVGLLRKTIPAVQDFRIDKMMPYETANNQIEISATASLGIIIEKMQEKGITTLTGETGIYILPYYQFKMVKGLITNFHQPKSTLLLLISSFLGIENEWKKIYNSAFDNNYRFLSYGDSSLLLP